MTALAAETAPGSYLSPFEALGMHELKGLPGHSHTVKALVPVPPQAFLRRASSACLPAWRLTVTTANTLIEQSLPATDLESTTRARARSTDFLA